METRLAKRIVQISATTGNMNQAKGPPSVSRVPGCSLTDASHLVITSGVAVEALDRRHSHSGSVSSDGAKGVSWWTYGELTLNDSALPPSSSAVSAHCLGFLPTTLRVFLCWLSPAVDRHCLPLLWQDANNQSWKRSGIGACCWVGYRDPMLFYPSPLRYFALPSILCIHV